MLPNGHWSVIGHHFVDDDLQFFHGSVELSWSRQKLTFDVLRHHFPHHEYLLRLVGDCELVLVLGRSWPTLANPTLASVSVLVVWPTLGQNQLWPKPTRLVFVCVCVCVGRRGFTRQPESSKRAHLRAPALQTPPKFNEKTSQRGKKRTNFAAGGKKKREILGPPPFGAPPFGAPPFWAPPFWAPPFWAPPFWAPPFWAPPFWAPPFWLHPSSGQLKTHNNQFQKTQTIDSEKPKSSHATETSTLAKVGLAKVGLAKVGLAKVGMAKVGLAKVGFDHSVIFNHHHAVSLPFNSLATMIFFFASQVWDAALLLGHAVTSLNIKSPTFKQSRLFLTTNPWHGSI